MVGDALASERSGGMPWGATLVLYTAINGFFVAIAHSMAAIEPAYVTARHRVIRATCRHDVMPS